MSPCPHRVHVCASQGGLGRRVLFAPWAPAVPILRGSSMAGWFGTSLGVSDTPMQPVLPPCLGGAIPHLSHCQAQRLSPACSPLPLLSLSRGSGASLGRAWHTSLGAARHLCLPVATPQIPAGTL